MRLTFGSVCSGIEAASCAWRPLGWEAAFVSEIEAFPRAVLKHRHPEVPLHGDFTTIQAGDYAPIDLLVGGTPCQSFSVAGLRGGLSDERGNLALEYLRLADRLRPRWLVWENVPGVLSSTSHDAPDPREPEDDLDSDNGPRDGEEVVVEDEYDADEVHAFACFLAGLSELGYGFAYRVLDAQYFGVAQRRRRVFVVGYLGDWRRAAAVLLERDSLSGNPSPRRAQGTGATHDLAPCLGASGRGVERAGETRGQDPVVAVSFDAQLALAPHGAAVVTEEAAPLKASGHKDQQIVAYGLRSDLGRSGQAKTPSIDASGRERLRDPGFNPTEGLAPTIDTGPPHAVAFALRGREGGAQLEVGGDVVGALRAANGGSSRDYLAIPLLEIGKGTSSRGDGPNGAGLGEAGDPMFTLQAGAQHGVGLGSAVRRLTPRECERLQGFTDDYTLIPWRGGVSSDGPRYKALGNSMAVPVMAWIGQRIEAVEALSAQVAA